MTGRPIFLTPALRCAGALVALALWAGGCAAPGRSLSITTSPPDALLRIDDGDTVQAPADKTFKFETDAQAHTIAVSRFGYTDLQCSVREADNGGLQITYKDPHGREVTETVAHDIHLALAPRRREITFVVSPEPAVVSLDGQPLETTPVSRVKRFVDFTVDSNNNWIPHTVTATRPGFPELTREVRWTDQDSVYNLQLEPFRKDLHISTRPPGAEVFLDGEARGVEPVSIKSYPFPVDPVTGQFVERKITARKTGYDPVTRSISWDGGLVDYTLDLPARTKTVQIVTDPPGGAVRLDGAELRRDPTGAMSATLNFAPDAKGLPRVYAGMASKTEAGADLEAPFQIAWDDGRRDYVVKLLEVKTRPAPLLRVRFIHGESGWRVGAETIETSAPKDAAEPAGSRATVVPVLEFPAGSTPDMLATSPDGSQLVYCLLSLAPDGSLRSRLQLLDLSTDAAAHKPRPLGAAADLALTPSFSPDGKQVLFSSTRGSPDGRRLSVWSIPADGSGPAVLTLPAAADSGAVWPSLDSLPHPRLFYEALIDGRPDARLFMTLTGPQSGGPTDMAQPGRQPHVGPKADSVLFDAPAGPAGSTSRRIYTIPDTGGQPTAISFPGDFDDFDPAWSKDGSRVAFASSRHSPRPSAPGIYNIWAVDLAHPEKPIQVTTSSAWDDNPAWDAIDHALFFRSNRGGKWGLWRASWK